MLKDKDILDKIHVIMMEEEISFRMAEKQLNETLLKVK